MSVLARKKARSVAGLSITSHHKPLRAFTKSACPADRAAPFMLDRAAAFGAGPLFHGRHMQLSHPAVFMHAGLDRLGDGIGAGKDLVVAETGGAVAGDAEELLDHLARL